MVGMMERTKAEVLVDSQEVKRALTILMHPGQVFEIRVLKATTAARSYKTNYSGYFNDLLALERALVPLKTAEGIYVTLQECDPDLLARAENKLLVAEKESSTPDHLILFYRWLLIDSDVCRKVKNISSTDEEHALALSHSHDVRNALRLDGWPEPLWADSGNGSHLLYPLRLSNDEGAAHKDTGLLSRTLKGLAARFNTDRIEIDCTVFNPSRICKLYGTRACKGDNTATRPHRMSRLLEVPAWSM